MSAISQVLKNCGNFSVEVLPGMLAYGREKERGRGHIQASNNLPRGDGYASKEGDIVLGGFIYRQAAQQAVAEGHHLSEMSVENKQKTALKICSRHMAQHGAIGPEYYKHWMKRARNFARHHHIPLPDQGEHESRYEYFRHVHSWAKNRPEPWPELRSSVGTHLVFSPDPKIWTGLRIAGVDERKFLHAVLTQTMKELGDWRRKIHGPDHSLGWVAGSHVRDNGADRHPHIHVMVLKRDEKGCEVDWSGSALRGRKGREQEPDQLREAKRLFSKNVEKQYEKSTGRELSPNAPLIQPYRSIHPNARFRELAFGLRTVFRIMNPHRYSYSYRLVDLGTIIRLARYVQGQRKDRSILKVFLRKMTQARSRCRESEPEV